MLRSLVPLLGCAFIASADEDALRKHVSFLASDEMKGRLAGTPEADRAADYIAEQFRAAGLRPGVGEGYAQRFTLRSFSSGMPFRVQIQADVSLPPLETPDGILTGTPLDTCEGVRTLRLQVSGALPQSTKGAAVLAASDLGKLGSPEYQQRSDALMAWLDELARVRPCVVVFATTENPPKQPLRFYQYGFGRGPDMGTPTVVTARADVFQWISKLPVGEIPAKVSVTAKPEYETGQTSNVIGVIQGSDARLRNSYILVSAHYDHLGMRGREGALWQMPEGDANDTIYNGAADNASGVAALIEAARLVAKARPRRSVAFIAFTGEDLSQVGSNYYVHNPVIPLQRTEAVVNLDQLAGC